MKTCSVLGSLSPLGHAHKHAPCVSGPFEILYILSALRTTLFCLIDRFSFTLSLTPSDTLERPTQSPSVYGTTRRSTKSRAQVSWAVSASCPTPSTDSKTLAVSSSMYVVHTLCLWTHTENQSPVWSLHAPFLLSLWPLPQDTSLAF